MAQEFYKKHGPRAHISAFNEFARSNRLSNEETTRTQEILVNRLGIYGLAGKVAAQQEDLSEGLGFSPDSDGRGGGVSGGSPASEYGLYGAGFVKPDQAAQRRDASTARKQARKLYKRNSSWGGPLGSQASQGANGVGNKGTVGGIRVPGGPIDTNEGGLVRVKVLSHSLVELNVGGTATMHSWTVFPEAIRHRLSDLGKATSSTWLPKVLHWAYNESMPGDEVIVDAASGTHFVNRKAGFAHLGRDWGTPG